MTSWGFKRPNNISADKLRWLVSHLKAEEWALRDRCDRSGDHHGAIESTGGYFALKLLWDYLSDQRIDDLCVEADDHAGSESAKPGQG